jgi:RNA polymerase sigma factor (sigma-70 family)
MHGERGGASLQGGQKARGDGTRRADPWLERFAARDRDAIREAEALVTRIVSCRSFGVGPAEREDLVQETLTQVWEAIEGPQFDPSLSFESFVRIVATRRCIDWRRCRKHTCELPVNQTAPGEDPECSMLARERALLARRLLGALGPGCRELIRLHAVEGLTYGEIARLWNRSEGALRVQMCGCLARARRILATIRGGTRL